MMIRYLGLRQVADRTGLSYNTIKAYSQAPGKMPQPDALTDRVKGWLPETIDRWIERRGERSS
ncbi:MAG: AlpA family phage regulatory protein [Mycobacterium sp.]|nr:AlpA family phage regulatory protein [Mycobacterium sp.]